MKKLCAYQNEKTLRLSRRVFFEKEKNYFFFLAAFLAAFFLAGFAAFLVAFFAMVFKVLKTYL